MGILSKLAVLITGNADGLTASLDKAGVKVTNFGERVKQAFGSNSGLKEFGEVLAGGGVIVGATLLANQFRDSAKAIEDLSTATRAGKADWQDWISKIGASIPIAGQVTAGLNSITEAITGQNAKLVENAQKWITLRDGMIPADKSLSSVKDNLEGMIGQMNRANELDGLTGLDLALAKIDQTTQTAQKQVAEQIIKEREAIDAFIEKTKELTGEQKTEADEYIARQEKIIAKLTERAQALIEVQRQNARVDAELAAFFDDVDAGGERLAKVDEDLAGFFDDVENSITDVKDAVAEAVVAAPQTGAPSAVELGSAAAQNALASIDANARGDDQRILIKQLEEAKKTRAILDKIKNKPDMAVTVVSIP